MGCPDGVPRGFPAAAPPKEAWVVSPGLPHPTVPPDGPGQPETHLPPRQRPGQSREGHRPAEAIKTMRPHKSSGMESMSGAAAALIKHSSDHMFPSTNTTPYPAP